MKHNRKTIYTKRSIPRIVASRSLRTAALRLIGILALAALAGGLPNTAKAAEKGKPSADSADARRELIMKDIVSRPFKNNTTMLGTVPFALSAYWLNERLPEADAAVIRAAAPDLPGVGSWKDQEGNHWHYNRQSFLLQRVYFLFNSRSEYFPGRMSKAAEDAVAATMWESVSTACKKEMTRPESMWWSGGSENIIARCMASFWGAAQIFASHPDYRDRKYADGTPVPEMARAFNDYYKEFTRQRASRGVMVEVASPTYTPWTLASWYNIADFSPDPVTRKRMKMFLDLFWADYAIEQIDGVRGGSRHRCYPGGYASVCGGGGSEVAWFFFGVGKPAVMNPKNISAMTTLYRPSPVVDALVRAGAARGTYTYVSRRLGKGATAEQVGKPKETAPDAKTTGGEDSEEKPADGKPAKPAQSSEKSEDAEAISAQADCTDPNGGNLLRTTFCTPDFVMGTSMVPALPLSAWTPISSQNRWEGVIFAGHPTTGIFPQAEGGHAYNASWSVQSKGVMIVQRLKTSKGAKGQRVWFDAPLKREERDGWVFAEAPQAYAAVRIVSGGSRWEPDPVTKGRPGKGMWLRCEDEYSPVIIETARKSDYPTFAAFQDGILRNSLNLKDGRLDYRSGHYATKLTLHTDYSKVPEVDGVPVNYNPVNYEDRKFDPNATIRL
jgi:hypothetical protein